MLIAGNGSWDVLNGKGLCWAADWLGSAYGEDVEAVLPRLFVIPDLSCYDNPDPLYPLSLRDARDGRRHTMVVASTGQERPLSFQTLQGKGILYFCLPGFHQCDV